MKKLRFLQEMTVFLRHNTYIYNKINRYLISTKNYILFLYKAGDNHVHLATQI